MSSSVSGTIIMEADLLDLRYIRQLRPLRLHQDANQVLVRASFLSCNAWKHRPHKGAEANLLSSDIDPASFSSLRLLEQNVHIAGPKARIQQIAILDHLDKSTRVHIALWAVLVEEVFNAWRNLGGRKFIDRSKFRYL